MARKGYNYFEKFVEQTALCKRAAEQLSDMLENYTDVATRADAVHTTEHQADDLLHEILSELNRSFITPIDREDIVGLANETDDIADAIEDVANLFDMLMITEVRPEAKEMAKLILAGCEALHEAVKEFANFKNSKKLNELIVKVNRVEEEADRTHRHAIKAMCQSGVDVMTFVKWKEILDAMEDVLDGCEDVSDLLEGLAIKNS